MDRRFIIILVVVVLGLGALFYFGRSSSSSNNTSSNSTTAGTVSNHTKGNNTKNVTLTVYGDFECPVCAQFFPVEKAVVDKYQDQISFRFAHFPLDNIHQNARAASRAAEAAGAQGKFFEMHDMLYERHSEWSESNDPLVIFSTYAQQLGLDVTKFKSDFASETTNSTINADLNEGNGLKVGGTPTYFLNGKQINNADISSVESFSAKIDEAIKASSSN